MTPQVKIRGNILHFDWVDTTKVSVAWTIGGYGKYSLKVLDGYPKDIPPANVAMDFYLNEWVQVQPPLSGSYCMLSDSHQSIKTSLFI